MDWKYKQDEIKQHQKIGSTKKISLRNVRAHNQAMETASITSTTSKTAAINQIYKKKSVKNLIEISGQKSFISDNETSMKYQDIRCSQLTQTSNFLEGIFCGENKKTQREGCQCQPKCIWMNYWFSISNRASNYLSKFPLKKEVDDQIRKDIQRTQPQYRQFTKIQFQQALYQCLATYARTDPQINYIQGMNIICSVLIYHGSSIDQCVQIFKHFMINCQFRNLFLRNFALAYDISNNFLQCLRLKCYDIYYHIVEKFEINFLQFIVGWLIPLMGNIVPLPQMHLVINAFMQKGWTGIIKIMISLLLYLKIELLSTNDQSEIMLMLSIQRLKSRKLNWQQIVRSSNNIKNLATMKL